MCAGALRLSFDHAQQGVELGGGAGAEVGCGGWAGGLGGVAGGDAAADFFERLDEALVVEGLEEVVDGVYFEGADGVLVEGRGEDDLRHAELLFEGEDFFEDGEAVEAGHADVEEDDVGVVGADEVDGFDAVGALGEDGDVAGGVEEVLEFLAGEGFVVNDQRCEGCFHQLLV